MTKPSNFEESRKRELSLQLALQSQIGLKPASPEDIIRFAKEFFKYLNN